MRVAWLDANVVLRFLTGEPAAQARRARALFARAERGEVVLHLAPVIAAEVVFVLESYYRYERGRIAEELKPLIVAEGIEMERRRELLTALDLMAERKVDFADAFVAALAQHGEAEVCSFDTDFRRLDVAVLTP